MKVKLVQVTHKRYLWGFQTTSAHSTHLAMCGLIARLYHGLPVVPAVYNGDKSKPDRNRVVRDLYRAGQSIPDIAQQLGLSNARVHQILHGKRKVVLSRISIPALQQ